MHLWESLSSAGILHQNKRKFIKDLLFLVTFLCDIWLNNLRFMWVRYITENGIVTWVSTRDGLNPYNCGQLAESANVSYHKLCLVKFT